MLDVDVDRDFSSPFVCAHTEISTTGATYFKSSLIRCLNIIGKLMTLSGIYH